MSSFDSLAGSTNVESASPAEIVTTSGVTIVVRDASPQATPLSTVREEPAPREELPRVVVAPPQAALDLNEIMRQLWLEHGAFMRRTLLRRGDVVAESAQDIMQEALLTAADRIAKHGVPEKVRVFLVVILRNKAMSWGQRWKPDVDREAETDVQPCAGRDPEAQAALAELWVKLERYIGRLPPDQAEVFQARAFDGLTFAEIAALVGRSDATVEYQYASAVEKLSELAAKSRRRAELGRRS